LYPREKLRLALAASSCVTVSCNCWGARTLRTSKSDQVGPVLFFCPVSRQLITGSGTLLPTAGRDHRSAARAVSSSDRSAGQDIMFYYLSFLRPPPSYSALTTPIPITPQIANDLRTEPFPGIIDIFYYWTSPGSSAPLTKPIKLTTWRQANAYKPLSALPPPHILCGALYCLVLTVATHSADPIDLCDPALGIHPLPVSSLPIAFPVRVAGKIAKQDAVERAFRVRDSVLRVREQTSFDLDKVSSSLGKTFMTCLKDSRNYGTVVSDSVHGWLRLACWTKTNCIHWWQKPGVSCLNQTAAKPSSS
jgi:hypothetical protein